MARLAAGLQPEVVVHQAVETEQRACAAVDGELRHAPVARAERLDDRVQHAPAAHILRRPSQRVEERAELTAGRRGHGTGLEKRLRAIAQGGRRGQEVEDLRRRRALEGVLDDPPAARGEGSGRGPGRRRRQRRPSPPQRQQGDLFGRKHGHDPVQADHLQQPRHGAASGHHHQPAAALAPPLQTLQQGQDAIHVEIAAVGKIDGEDRMGERFQKTQLAPQRLRRSDAQLAGTAKGGTEFTG